MWMIKEPTERRLGRDATHEHQLARRHGRERRELRRGPPPRRRAQQVLRVLYWVVARAVTVTVTVAVLFRRRCVVGAVAVGERDHDRRRVQMRFVVRKAGRWTHVYT